MTGCVINPFHGLMHLMEHRLYYFFTTVPSKDCPKIGFKLQSTFICHDNTLDEVHRAASLCNRCFQVIASTKLLNWCWSVTHGLGLRWLATEILVQITMATLEPSFLYLLPWTLWYIANKFCLHILFCCARRIVGGLPLPFFPIGIIQLPSVSHWEFSETQFWCYWSEIHV